ncbi:MAG: hypothetical protein MUF52_07680 [Syntrophobacteraceae bacterium]|jgi:hypothetical protein|nr:hypothetical protein [Syntrophobacteraceae bacterium]
MWTYVLAWVPMVAIAIINGALREATYGKRMSEPRAHQVSTLSGMVLFSVYIWGVTAAWPLRTSGQAVTVGLLWLVLTLAFEFLFGHFVAGHSWKRLLQDYNILEGRVWVLIPIWVAVAPLVFQTLHGNP